MSFLKFKKCFHETVTDHLDYRKLLKMLFDLHKSKQLGIALQFLTRCYLLSQIVTEDEHGCLSNKPIKKKKIRLD